MCTVYTGGPCPACKAVSNFTGISLTQPYHVPVCMSLQAFIPYLGPSPQNNLKNDFCSPASWVFTGHQIQWSLDYNLQPKRLDKGVHNFKCQPQLPLWVCSDVLKLLFCINSMGVLRYPCILAQNAKNILLRRSDMFARLQYRLTTCFPVSEIGSSYFRKPSYGLSLYQQITPEITPI